MHAKLDPNDFAPASRPRKGFEPRRVGYQPDGVKRQRQLLAIYQRALQHIKLANAIDARLDRNERRRWTRAFEEYVFNLDRMLKCVTREGAAPWVRAMLANRDQMKSSHKHARLERLKIARADHEKLEESLKTLQEQWGHE